MVRGWSDTECELEDHMLIGQKKQHCTKSFFVPLINNYVTKQRPQVSLQKLQIAKNSVACCLNGSDKRGSVTPEIKSWS